MITKAPVQFNCVFNKKAITIKRFLRSVESDDVVNYMEIINKLTKNDIYSVEPSDEVINSYLIKYLEKSIVDKENRIIYYVISELDTDIIDNLQTYIERISPVDVVFNLWVDLSEEAVGNDIGELFDNVLEIVAK